MPSDHFTFPESARTIFPLLANAGRYFSRDGIPVEVSIDADGEQQLRILTPEVFQSTIDRLANLVKVHVKAKRTGKLGLVDKRCSRDRAIVLLATQEAREILPSIRLVTKACVIVPGSEGPKVLGPGYHRDAGGVLVTAKHLPGELSLADAVAAIDGLLVDFQFPTPSDKSRALADTITPALVMGGWLPEWAPIQVAEADVSQSGKTYRQKVTRAIYGEQAYKVAKRDGGVGSLDESLAQGLLSGSPFIAFDNLRGRLDSQFLEGMITWGSHVPVRVPHRGEIQVDPRAVTFQITSNGVETTRDLANRASITRIRKQPKGYSFKAWPEGDLLGHVKANSARYLGSVFAVIQEWARQGKPRSKNVQHDSREWAGVLGWIVENLFGGAPLMDGHVAAQARVSSLTLTWLREVCLAVEREGRMGEELSASNIAEICESDDIDVPRLSDKADKEVARKHIGILLGRAFKEAADSDPNKVDIDGFSVTRADAENPHHRSQPRKVYLVARDASREMAASRDSRGPRTPTESTPFSLGFTTTGTTGTREKQLALDAEYPD